MKVHKDSGSFFPLWLHSVFEFVGFETLDFFFYNFNWISFMEGI